MRARRIGHELMDEADPQNARECLRNLTIINRRFGGHSAIRKLLEKANCGDRPFSMLDIGAASGDSARLVQAAYPNATVVNLDRNEVNLSAAPEPKILADAFQLPFAPASFDYVFSSLFLHHFEDRQIVSLLRSFASIARRAVLIADLERHIVPYLFLPISQYLFRWHWMTVYDGQLSVRAALKGNELAALAREAGLKTVQVDSHRPAFRLTLIGKTA